MITCPQSKCDLALYWRINCTIIAAAIDFRKGLHEQIIDYLIDQIRKESYFPELSLKRLKSHTVNVVRAGRKYLMIARSIGFDSLFLLGEEVARFT
jgi:hypothetical protein